MSFLQEGDLETKPLLWQHHRMHKGVTYMLRYIIGAKFLHCLWISRIILDFVIDLHTVTTHLFPFNLNISSWNQRRYYKKENAILHFEGPFKKLNLYSCSFYFIGT